MEQNKKKFIVAIEETVVEEFEVVSDTEEEALEFAKKQYKKGVFVLSPGEVRHRQMAIINTEKESTEWFEF